MTEKPKINAWVFKEKELLEKLSLEISRNFSISEKLAKKFIYETHLSLEDLKTEIKELNNEENKDIELHDRLDVEKLYLTLSWARELIEKASKTEIKELKEILEKEKNFSWEESEVIRKIFSEKLIDKAKNPQNIWEQILGASYWILNSTMIIWELLYGLWVWIIKSVPDLISIIKWEAVIDSFKKV